MLRVCFLGRARESPANDLCRFGISFSFVVLAGIAFVYLSPVREHLVAPFTDGITALSGWTIWVFGAAVTVRGNVLAIPGFAVQVLDMCNGVEASIVLWWAILAFPAPALHNFR
jgi:hypothetical protein